MATSYSLRCAGETRRSAGLRKRPSAGFAFRTDNSLVATFSAKLSDYRKQIKMEHLDPIYNGEWEDISDHDREFYRTCVESILENKTSLAIDIVFILC